MQHSLRLSHIAYISSWGFRRRIKGASRAVFARWRRAIVWRQIRREAHIQGFEKEDLRRFYRYLSINLGLEKPQRTNSLQKPRNHFPGLRSQPVHDASAFPWTDNLIANFELIQQELFEYTSKTELDKHPQNVTDRGRWSVLYFHAGGRPVQATERACVKTSKLIDSIPGAGQAGQVYLSVLQPGTHIRSHFGPTNTRLRCHLGLAVPSGARIRIGAEMCRWREGECLIFDDSFEHEVWNESSTERAVLIIDFWHPELSPAERWAIDRARKLKFGIRDMLHT